MQYIGEHLIFGRLGSYFIYISFLSIFFSCIHYFVATRNEDDLKRIKVGGILFYIHAFSLLGAVSCLYILLFNHYYEYRIVWQYTSNASPIRYVISCLWAGQEGSFIIWAFLQALTGIILMKTSFSWKAHVMSIFGLSQLLLTLMLLGVNFFGLKIGASPFILIREASENIGLEFFKNRNYLELITDGNGLNPLLQNFWMTSHPPILFLGYSLTLIPFAYAVAGFWKKQYNKWIIPVFPWIIISLLILGVGIILGAAWAYESLPFGGFWSWDPIENASLIPWLLLLAALHMMFVTRKSGDNLRLTFILSVLPFILVLYASFLTKSGILADSSVHAFSDTSKFYQLLIFLLVFLFIPIYQLIKNLKLPSTVNKEILWERSFWLFVAVIVILFSTFQIFFSTSIPVFNKMFGLSLAPPIDRSLYFLKWQIPFMIFMLLLISVTQYFKYGQNEMRKIFKQILIILLFSAFLFSAIYFFLPEQITTIFILSIFILLFSTIASIDHFIKKLNRRASLVHLGFSIFLLGMVISFPGKKILSDNIKLTKNENVKLDDYYVNYKRDTFQNNKNIYEIKFSTKKDSIIKSLFTLSPSITLNRSFGNLYEPDIKHLISKDIFAFITFADVSDISNNSEDNKFHEIEIGLKDSIWFENNLLILDSLIVDKGNSSSSILKNIKINAKLEIIHHSGEIYAASLDYIIQNDSVIRKECEVKDLKLKLYFEKVSDKPQHIFIKIQKAKTDFIVIKAMSYPMINLLWFGILIMIIGFGISALKNLSKS